VHLPIFPLITRCEGGLRGNEGVIPVFIRIILDDQPYLSLELIEQLFDDRTGRLAVRSLEVEELDDRDRGILRPLLRRVVDGNAVPLHVRECSGKEQ
jgi:hypothetical protein